MENKSPYIYFQLDIILDFKKITSYEKIFY